MIKQELINKIKNNFDLNIYETKVWIALLGKGIASAGEIAEISGVPRSRTYDVLESLEKRGFALMKLGKPVKYIAVRPDTIIEKLKTNTLKKANEKIDSIIKLKDTNEYSELKELYTVGIQPIRQEEISGSIKGKSSIYNHIKELLGNAQKEVIICTSAYEIQSKSRFFTTLFKRLEKSNIKVNIALSGDEKEINKINKKFNIKSKKIDINTRFFIADNKELLFMISNTEDDEIAVWLNTPFFTSTLSFMFEQATKI